MIKTHNIQYSSVLAFEEGGGGGGGGGRGSVKHPFKYLSHYGIKKRMLGGGMCRNRETLPRARLITKKKT